MARPTQLERAILGASHRIDAAWGKTHHDPARFAAASRGALGEVARLARSAEEVAAWLAGAPSMADQASCGASVFTLYQDLRFTTDLERWAGASALTLYQGPRFTIELERWASAGVGPLGHGAAGWVKVLSGSCLRATWSFAQSGRLGAIRLGALAPTEVARVAAGQAFPLHPDELHALAPLDAVTVLVCRTTPAEGALRRCLVPSACFVPHRPDALMTRRLQLARTLLRLADPRATDVALAAVRACDAELAFHLLLELVPTYGSVDALRPLLDGSIALRPELGPLRPALEWMVTGRALQQARWALPSAEQRLAWTLMSWPLPPARVRALCRSLTGALPSSLLASDGARAGARQAQVNALLRRGEREACAGRAWLEPIGLELVELLGLSPPQELSHPHHHGDERAHQ